MEECKLILSGMGPYHHNYMFDYLLNTLLLQFTLFTLHRKSAADGRGKTGFVEEVHGEILQITRRLSSESPGKITSLLFLFSLHV